MAGFIVDASILVEYLVSGPHARVARNFLHQLSAEDVLIAPDFCLTECTNAIWKQHRFHGMPEEQAIQLFDVLCGMDLQTVAIESFLGESLTIGMRHRLAIYDSCYLALAADLGYPLVSLDRGQLRAAGAEGLSLINLASHPL